MPNSFYYFSGVSYLEAGAAEKVIQLAVFALRFVLAKVLRAIKTFLTMGGHTIG